MNTAQSNGETTLAAYACALEEYVSGGGEAALTVARQLGRRAINDGVSIVEIAVTHHQTLGELWSRPSSTSKNHALVHNEILTLAAQFFAETVSTFEITVRSYQANARLLGLSEELARPNAASERAQRQLQIILDATTSIIYLKDTHGRYLFVNRQFQNAFALRRENVIGKTDLEALPAPAADVIWKSDRRAMIGLVPLELEEIIPSSSGPHAYLSLKFPLLSESGVVNALCCVATDISERKLADEALRRAKEAADAANAELETFAYSVSHDLRTPLRHVIGFGRILGQRVGSKLDAEEHEILEKITGAADRMSKLIDELLHFSRLNRVELTGTDVNLNEVVEGVILQFQLEMEGRAIVWQRSGLPRVRGDRSLLHQVFVNLISNALKYTRPRNPAKIEYGCRDGREEMILFIRDNGVGFDPRYADKLFGVFQRLHSEEEFEGAGIGLANVRRIILRHGGRVWADATPGQGATFYFTLPRSLCEW